LAALPHLVVPAHQVLSPQELAKAGRFRQSADRERFVLGRAFVRNLCARHLKILASAVSFEESATGRPHLRGVGLDFNVSHSGDCVLVAWSTAGRVGADVEWIKERDPGTLTDMARSSFSTDEFEVFSAASNQERTAIFYRVWVRKEALIKAEGVGLGGALKEFSVVRLEAGCPVWQEDVLYLPSGRVWSLVDLVAPQGYAAALAVAQGASVHGGSNVLLG
jgi:4'-phosphopantetheinyl transferase